MRLRAAVWPLAALLAALPLAAAFSDSLPPVPVRVGTHEGYSRVAFNLTSRTDYHVTQEGQRVVVQFAGDVVIGAANGVPRMCSLSRAAPARRKSSWRRERSFATGGSAMLW